MPKPCISYERNVLSTLRRKSWKLQCLGRIPNFPILGVESNQSKWRHRFVIHELDLPPNNPGCNRHHQEKKNIFRQPGIPVSKPLFMHRLHPGSLGVRFKIWMTSETCPLVTLPNTFQLLDLPEFLYLGDTVSQVGYELITSLLITHIGSMYGIFAIISTHLP